MTTTQRFGRIGLSIALIGTLLGACDDNDDDTGSDTNAQRRDAGENPDASVRTTGRAGRGGSGGATARAGTGGTGGSTTATTGGTGGTSASGGRGGAGGTSATGGTGGTAGNGGIGGTTNVQLSDAQIAAFTSTANLGEVSLGMLALTRVMLPAVRDFAQMMISMHTAAQTRQNAVLNTLGLTIAASPLSTQLENDAMQVTAQLNAAAANQFDLAYIRSQVDIHAKVLTIVDDQLLPNVSATALRADLTLTRSEVVSHLAAARVLLEQLENASDAGVP